MKTLHAEDDPFATVDITTQMGAQALLAAKYAHHVNHEQPGIFITTYDCGPDLVTYQIQDDDPLPVGLTTDNMLDGEIRHGIAVLTSW